jgi:hypothetical protein
MLQEPEEEERDDLHAHYPYECATEASIVGCVIFGLRHGRQYASETTRKCQLRYQLRHQQRCSYPSRIMQITRIHADRTIRDDANCIQEGRCSCLSRIMRMTRTLTALKRSVVSLYRGSCGSYGSTRIEQFVLIRPIRKIRVGQRTTPFLTLFQTPSITVSAAATSEPFRPPRSG